MMAQRLFLLSVCAAVLAGCGGGGGGGDTQSPTNPQNPGGLHNLTSILFVHHSVGDGLVVNGDMRATIAAYNTAHSTSLAFWDHGYNGDGLRDASGTFTGANYDIPNDNTDPEGYYLLWTSTDPEWVACRNQIMQNHQIIAFKSCFPNSAIDDAATLQQYEDWYLAMRNYFDAHTDHLFIVMPPPPLHRLATDATQAANARAFATWLSSSTYLGGHPNVCCFDLFDQLANPNDGSPTANMLRQAYEGSTSDSDSHPNAAADQVVGPALAEFICEEASGY